ncbi:MAG TPA: site-specific tyrosine recombinase XerD [candidate division Zixibacteria bacterium]|nr:site-specific tyrosine recombinase XerD [candidate division Zixibacteria bacterium]
MNKHDQNKRCLLDFLGYVDLELNLSHNTIAAYRHDLFDFCEFLRQRSGRSLTVAGDAEILDYIINLRKKGISARSAARKLSAIKHLYKFLLAEKHVKDDPTTSLESPKLLRALPDVLSKDEVTRLIESCDGEDPLGLRDRAILELWYACGLRISEVGKLKIGDVVMEIDILRVKGKGNKERLVPFGSYAKKALEVYLRDSRPLLVKDKSFDTLFLSRKGGGLSRMGLWGIFEKCVKKAQIMREITPHILRHSCATHMVEGGADIRTVMEFLGHADISTTQIYTHLDQRYLKEVHRRFHPREKDYEPGNDLQISDMGGSPGGKTNR